jgi:Fur family transcriptional regulator, ferric uptake regulator
MLMAVTESASNPYGSLRATPRRRLIAETAATLRGAFSVDDLARSVRSRETTVGVATVYRAVSALVGIGWLERVGERDGRALYARCDAGEHHHHVICDGCGRVEVTTCPVATAVGGGAGESESAAGFVITRHEVTLYGLCPACAADQSRRATSPGKARRS